MLTTMTILFMCAFAWALWERSMRIECKMDKYLAKSFQKSSEMWQRFHADAIQAGKRMEKLNEQMNGAYESLSGKYGDLSAQYEALMKKYQSILKQDK